MIPTQLPQIITAIGGLGTAAFGLLEAIKPVVPWINRTGFSGIQKTVLSLTPDEPEARQPVNALPQKNILESLLANWMNGTDLASQKAIAKSLIKLHLSAGNAAVSDSVTPVAISISNDAPLPASACDAASMAAMSVASCAAEVTV